MVVVFSRHSNESPHVHREVILSINHHCQLVPFRVDATMPTGNLEYCLCAPHWLGGPKGGTAAELDNLAEVVACLLSSASGAKPAGVACEVERGGELGPMDRQRLFVAIANAMIEQGDTAFRLDSLSENERNLARSLVGSGVLLERACDSADGQWLAPAPGGACRQILAEWAAENASLPAQELLGKVESLPSLAGGIAAFLAEQKEPESHPLYAGCLGTNAPGVRQITRAVFEAIASDESGLVRLSRTVVSRQDREALVGVLEGVVALTDAGDYAKAGAVLGVLRLCPQAAFDGPADRLVALIGNEYGRLLKQTNAVDGALAQFRRTLAAAEKLGDPVLIGQIGHNVAWCLLERPHTTGEQWQEAFELLTRNRELFTAPAAILDLACTYNLLGEAYSRRNAAGDAALAKECFQRDVSLCRQSGQELPLIDALDRFAVFLLEQGDTAEAQKSLDEELGLCMHCGEPKRRAARVLANLGVCDLRTGFGMAESPERSGILTQAKERLSRSRDLYRELNEPRLLATTLDSLGRTLILLGEEAEGLRALQDCVAQYRSVPGMGDKADTIDAAVEQWLAERAQT
jgi:tetratricopeptide (TPR) repeat protein